MRPYRVCPVLRLALEMASANGGVTSIEIARSRHLCLATASSRLGRYADRGWLRVIHGTGGPLAPLVYAITPLGLDRLAEMDDPKAPADFGPLLACWGFAR